MRLNRVVAYLLGCAAFLASLLVYMTYINRLGFPDGFITELGYAERRLAYIFIGVSLIVGSYLIYLGTVAARKMIGWKLSAVVILYLISIVVMFLIDNYYSSHLMDGAGG